MVLLHNANVGITEKLKETAKPRIKIKGLDTKSFENKRLKRRAK